MESDVLTSALMLVVPFVILAVARIDFLIIADAVFLFYATFATGVDQQV